MLQKRLSERTGRRDLGNAVPYSRSFSLNSTTVLR